MTEPVILAGNAQHRGDRAQQQDSFGFSNPDDPELRNRCGSLAVIADGMGGHALGRETSQIAVKTLVDGYPRKAPDEPVFTALRRLTGEANTAIRDLAAQEGQLDNAGTTLAAAVIHQQHLHWLSVGDSRIYLCHAGQVTQLSVDHTYARDLDCEVAAGLIDAADAAEHPEREALTSYLGIPELDRVDCGLHPALLQIGDRVLLCSDGLYRNLNEVELAAELVRPDPQAAAEALLERALARRRPYQDNLTVAILAVTEAPAAVGPDRRRAGIFAGAVLLASIGLAARWWFGPWP